MAKKTPKASAKSARPAKAEKPAKPAKKPDAAEKPSKVAKPAAKAAPDAKTTAIVKPLPAAKPAKKVTVPVVEDGVPAAAPAAEPKAKPDLKAAKASKAKVAAPAKPNVSRAVAAAAAEMESDGFDMSDRTAVLDPRPSSEPRDEAPVAPAAPAEPPKPLPIPTDLPPRRADGTITVAHSPDADDAFMFYALANGKVETEGRRYEHVLKDIQTLNEDAKKGTYDVTAISFAAYPYVRQNYALLTCGASFGDAYGPILVAKSPIRPNEVEGLTVALPGALTTAALVTKLWFGRAKIRAANLPFDKVMDAVRAGIVRAGVLIHEGQLTYKEQGLVKVVDFGQWWSDQTEGLPLPLGGNGVRRDIDKATAEKIALDVKRSIAYALGHREEALAYAMKFGRNLPKEKADAFVGMYVNDLTLDYGERGRQALLHLYDRAYRAGLLAEVPVPEYVG